MLGSRSRARRRAALAAILACAYTGTAAAHAANVGNLPNNRAYELVSPPDKKGADIAASTDFTRVSTDGDAVTFMSLGGFADVRGGAIQVLYKAQRTGSGNGWTTRAISPRQDPTTFERLVGGGPATFEDAFTPDLSEAIYRAGRPLTDAPNVERYPNLYRLRGLGTSNPAVPQLLTDAVAPLPTNLSPSNRPVVAGASTDLSHVLYEVPRTLTTDAAPPPATPSCVLGGICPLQLYENADGVVRFVGRVPRAPATSCDDVNGPACVSSTTSQAGRGASQLFAYTSQMISRDGARIMFHASTDVGGGIYMRVNGTQTVQLNASEKSSAERAGDAQLWSASADGSRIFFITSEGLVDGDDDSSPDVYMYDTDRPSRHLTLISEDRQTADGGDFVEGIIGNSDDGQYLYFIVDGQLVAGESALNPLAGLYLWHDGAVRYLGQWGDTNLVSRNGLGALWKFADATNHSRVSPDGKHLLLYVQNEAGFDGHAGFQQRCRGFCQEFLSYDADSNVLRCVSCKANGVPAASKPFVHVRDGVGGAGGNTHLAHALTDDGRRVFFNTADSLVPDDGNGKVDAYEYDMVTGTVHLISSGTSPANSYFLDASSNGDDVFFVTRDRLTGWDTDENYDLYDARVNGGIPEPVAIAPGCSGEACRGPQGDQPAVGTATSRLLAGAGDVGERLKVRKARRGKRCGRGKVAVKRRGKVRCVRRASRGHVARGRAREKGGAR